MIRHGAGLCLLALLGTAAAEGRAPYGGKLVASLLHEPVDIDPASTLGPAEHSLGALVFDTLFQLGPEGRVSPHLAAELPQVEGSRARFRIRAGVEFHDGTVVGAEDAARSLARAWRGPTGWILAGVRNIEAVNDEVVLDFEKAPPENLAERLAAPSLVVTPQGAAPSLRHAVGSGPFSLTTLDRRRQVASLRAFDRHFAGRPYIDELELSWFDQPLDEARRFESGAAHISIRGATAFAGQQPKFRTVRVDGPLRLLTCVTFGTSHRAITADVVFRRAFHLALPRAGFSLLGGDERIDPAVTPVPGDFGGTALAAGQRAGDPAAALAMLAGSATLTPGLLGNTTLEVIIERSRPEDREVAVRLLRTLDRLGISGRMVEVAAEEMLERKRRGQGDLFVTQLALPANAAMMWMMGFEAGGDLGARAAFASGAAGETTLPALFAARLPIIPLFHRSLRAFHRSDLKGLAFDRGGRLGLADMFFHGSPERSRSR
jgi:ABC-type transport system substrate-binding protein